MKTLSITKAKKLPGHLPKDLEGLRDITAAAVEAHHRGHGAAPNHLEDWAPNRFLVKFPEYLHWSILITNSAAQGGGGSFRIGNL